MKFSLGDAGILLAVAGVGLLLMYKDTAFIGVGAGYQGYTKYVKPAPKPTPASRARSSGGGVGGQGKVGGTAQKRVIQREGGSQKAAEDRAAKKRAVAAAMTPSQRRLYAEISQIKTVGQLKAYIANKANRIVALVNAARRLRGQPPLVKKSGIRPVQFGGLGVGNTGLLSAGDISAPITNNLGNVFKKSQQLGGVDSQLQKVINGAMNEVVRNNFNVTGTINPGQKNSLAGPLEEIARS